MAQLYQIEVLEELKDAIKEANDQNKENALIFAQGGMFGSSDWDGGSLQGVTLLLEKLYKVINKHKINL